MSRTFVSFLVFLVNILVYTFLPQDNGPLEEWHKNFKAKLDQEREELRNLHFTQ